MSLPPRAWVGTGVITGQKFATLDPECCSEACGPFEPLYDQAALDAHAAAARLAALEEAAKLLDREHEARKHLDNHAAFYARKIRELATHVTPTCTDFGEK